MDRTEFAIKSRVAEVERELPGLHLNGQRVGGWRGKVNRCPRLRSEKSQSENFESHQYESSDHQTHCAAGKISDLLARFAVGEHPDEGRKDHLCRHEADASLNHRV